MCLYSNNQSTKPNNSPLEVKMRESPVVESTSPEIISHVDAATQWKIDSESMSTFHAKKLCASGEITAATAVLASKIPNATRTTPVADNLSQLVVIKRQTSQIPHVSPLASDDSQLSKRMKTETKSFKALPLNYEFCPVKDMVILISNMIQELIHTNDNLPLRPGVLTRFHSRTPPAISVAEYLQRLAKHATLTPPLLLSMVYYIDQLCLLYPPFTINSLTVHRFLITAGTVAAKGLSDSFWNNATYARVGGIKVAELGLLELDFLYRLDWKIVPNPEALVNYYQGLIARNPSYRLKEDEKSSVCDEDGNQIEEPIDDPSRLEGDNNKKWKAWMDDITSKVFVQPICSIPPQPEEVANVVIQLPFLEAEISSYEIPDLSSLTCKENLEEAKHLRVGIYDPLTATWTSSTTITSAVTFAKGYSPIIVLSLNKDVKVVSVSIKSHKIDAGQTRNFGPKLRVMSMKGGVRPTLLKPVILKEGQSEDTLPEKSFLQRYWWVLLAGVILAMSAGGSE
ncbi:BgTH12-01163 [Blumeria graminis f. sp. triticale]|uniref:BgTH12-01163 n=1 Tax=Blumeria graminis f. sp. triticale TaxID=1689686 RepID=A0A9W4GI83_BLUGR|nr:BgTH12-01163 [Blumeria graminis f. sp. triticale]